MGETAQRIVQASLLLVELITLVAVVAEALVTSTAQTGAAASCASGYTRKRNKLKGERLCTTL